MHTWHIHHYSKIKYLLLISLLIVMLIVIFNNAH